MPRRQGGGKSLSVGGTGAAEEGDEEGKNDNKASSSSSWSGTGMRRRRNLGRVKHLLATPFRKLERIRQRPHEPQLPRFYEDDDYNPPSKAGCCFIGPTAPDKQQPVSTTYHDLLRSLIEKNDFYSPDCNVHHAFE